MKRGLTAAAMVLLVGSPALAHRLDEYLQGTLISVEKHRVDAEITLTPGVTVFPLLIAAMDRDADGVISEAEQRAYAEQILRDLSISIDGVALKPRLISRTFPVIDEMKEGRGEIRVEFNAELPRGSRDRILIFENGHQSKIAAYQVNCLVPRDPEIRIRAQNRNYSQSFYELDFTDTSSAPVSLAGLTGAEKPLAILALMLSVRLAWLWARKSRAACGQLSNSQS
jgi:hypothetical protein